MITRRDDDVTACVSEGDNRLLSFLFSGKSPPDFSTDRPAILTVPAGGGHGEVNVGAEESLRGSRDGFMTRAGSGKGHFRERDRPQGDSACDDELPRRKYPCGFTVNSQGAYPDDCTQPPISIPTLILGVSLALDLHDGREGGKEGRREGGIVG